MKNPISRLVQVFKTFSDRSKRPLHIEFNLTDYCNLNCKGCSHYSPVAPEEYESLESLERSMKCIASAKNLDLIESVYLIGGETLLYPSITAAMLLARRYFPKAKISIFTNGILIPKLDEEFWKVCRQTDSVMAITRYPLRVDYDRLEEICRKKGVKAEIFGDRSLKDSFFKLPLDPEKKQNPKLSHLRCCSFGCITVDNGRIFPCSQSACVRHLNNRFGTDFKWKKGDYIEVQDLGDSRRLLKLRNRPVPFCGYCRHQSFTPYGPSKRELSEWT